jgi:hypothetical protein
MFERFTDRARRVLVLAQEEARLMNHSFIGTEHILLGVVSEGEGVGAQALEAFDIELDTVREKVREIVGPSQGPTGSAPFTPRAKRVLELSLREALSLGHSYIGTEHLVLGVLREGEGVAAQVLVSLGADPESVRERVLELLSGYGVLEHRTGGVRGRAVGESVWCRFCGLRPPESGRLVAGERAFICERCISEWAQRLRDEAGTRERTISATLYDAPTGHSAPPSGAEEAGTGDRTGPNDPARPIGPGAPGGPVDPVDPGGPSA